MVGKLFYYIQVEKLKRSQPCEGQMKKEDECQKEGYPESFLEFSRDTSR